MSLTLPPTELTFTGPALPESFIQHELEHALGKALPSAKDAEAGWKALLKSLREPLTSAGSIRVRNVVINPVMKALGYAEMIAAEDVRTREGDESGGVLLLPSPVNGGGTKGGGLRVWAVAYEDDLDAPTKRGLNYRFSPGRVAERVLLATGERIGLLTNGLELRLIFSDPARRASFASFSLSQWKQYRYYDPVPDAFRVLIALAQADAQRDARLQDVIEQARLKQGQVTKDLRVQARKAVEAFVQSVLDHPQNRERIEWLIEPQRHKEREDLPEDLAFLAPSRLIHDRDTLARELWREALTMIYRLLFILRGESGGRETPPFSFASTSLWRNTYSPSNAQPGNLAWVAQKVREEGMPSGEFLEAGLRAIFKAFEHGLNATELHIAPLGGALFGAESTPLLDRLKWGEHGCAELIDNLLRAPRGKGQGRSLVRLSYRDLGVEELGRVYEALLELEPGISAEAMVRLRRAKLEVVVPEAQGEKYRPKGNEQLTSGDEQSDEEEPIEDEEQSDAGSTKSKIEWIEAIAPDQFYLRVGLGRKSSGGHYTPDTFVRFLVQETLGPLIETLSPKDDPQPLAILRLNVLDGAMGSGHILIGACRFMGERLYEACVACAERGRWERIPVEVAPYLPGRRPEGESEAGLSAEKARAMCKRLVAVHCLYGVDKNLLAVSLAKVSLWLESFAEGLPLTFLDHRLVCGDSLLGPINLFGDAANTAAADSPMTPPYATTPIDVALAQGVKAQLRDRLGVALQRVRDLDATVGTDEADIAAKHNAKRDLDAALQPFIDLCVAWSGGIMLGREHVDEDGYCEAMKLVASGQWPVISDPIDLTTDHYPLSTGFLTMLKKGRDAGVLVYPLVFPEVFFPTGDVDHMDGFDAEIMNPPWDQVEVSEPEFWAAFDLDVLAANTARERKTIQKRLMEDTGRKQLWLHYLSLIEEQQRAYDRLFSYQTVKIDEKNTAGRPDLYRLFAERIVYLLNQNGLTGIVVPSAFHVNEGATGVRRLYFSTMSLEQYFCFENRRKLFEIDGRFKFAVLVARKSQELVSEFSAGFYLHDDEWLFSDSRVPSALSLTKPLIEAMSGEYLNFIEFRNPEDVRVAEQCYHASEMFNDYCRRAHVRFGVGLEMSRDFEMFTPARQVLSGIEDPRDPNAMALAANLGYLLLHEGKTFNQFTDHWGEAPKNLVGVSEIVSRKEWADEARFYKMAFRRIANATNERTYIFAVLPAGVLVENNAPAEFEPSKRPNSAILIIVGLFNAYTTDWIGRLRVSAYVSLGLLKSQPIPNPILAPAFLAHSTLRLTCNHAGYAPLWAEQLGDEWREGTPRHTWPVLAGDDARWDVRAAIDAVVAQAYGLSREQYAHVLSTFSHKSYPSAPKVCLAKFDELSVIGLEAFTRKYDPYWDVPLVESLPRPVIDLTPALAGTPSPAAQERGTGGEVPTDLFGNPLQTDLFGEVVQSTKGKKRNKRK